jgi:hypothetical protein
MHRSGRMRTAKTIIAMKEVKSIMGDTVKTFINVTLYHSTVIKINFKK